MLSAGKLQICSCQVTSFPPAFSVLQTFFLISLTLRFCSLFFEATYSAFCFCSLKQLIQLCCQTGMQAYQVFKPKAHAIHLQFFNLVDLCLNHFCCYHNFFYLLFINFFPNFAESFYLFAAFFITYMGRISGNFPRQDLLR